METGKTGSAGLWGRLYKSVFFCAIFNHQNMELLLIYNNLYARRSTGNAIWSFARVCESFLKVESACDIIFDGIL